MSLFAQKDLSDLESIEEGNVFSMTYYGLPTISILPRQLGLINVVSGLESFWAPSVKNESEAIRQGQTPLRQNRSGHARASPYATGLED